MKPLDLWQQRIEPRVVKQEGGCWVWTGGTNGRYGQIGITAGGRRMFLTHVIAYEVLVGRVADGLELDHLCQNSLCCNPEHLEPVTHSENIIRGRGSNALTARTKVCKRGHRIEGANAYRQGDGRVRCRSCKCGDRQIMSTNEGGK